MNKVDFRILSYIHNIQVDIHVDIDDNTKTITPYLKLSFYNTIFDCIPFS